jgi:DNA-binding MltR family transcriptional regulator
MVEIAELIDTKINTKMNEVIQQTDFKIKAAVDPLNDKIDVRKSII